MAQAMRVAIFYSRYRHAEGGNVNTILVQLSKNSWILGLELLTRTQVCFDVCARSPDRTQFLAGKQL
jgi:hypothetical protein